MTTKGATPKSAKKNATKTKRSANVPGQFYGYSVQLTRVVAHFLRAQQGQSVSIEHLDDVATHTDAGDIVEQDKSGLAHNPVTDRSPELWKSLANWVRAIRAGALKEDTRFLLYVAQGHRGDLIDSIHGATSKVAADAVVVSIRATFGGKAKLPKGLFEHVGEVLSASDEVLARLFMNLTLENGSGAPNDDLAAMPGMAAISEPKKKDVLTFLLGWAKKTVDKRIEQGQAAVIMWNEFRKAFVAAAKKFDRAENVLLASPVDIIDATLQKELSDRTYVRQLQIVQCDDDDMVRAVHDYLRSSTHRTNWSEDGDVIESSFDEFESSLDRAWKSQKAVVDIEQKAHADADRGRLLYAKCQQLKVPLQGMDVPDFFVPGSFHTMADSLRVGWHPRYREAVAAFVAGQPTNDQNEVSAVAPVTEPARKRKPSTVPPAAAAAGGEFVDDGGGA
ncbi:MAG: ABC-three component system protein [Kofleriaceae bacterium]